MGTRHHEVDVVVPGNESVMTHGAEQGAEGEHVFDSVGFAEVVEFEKKIL